MYRRLQPLNLTNIIPYHLSSCWLGRLIHSEVRQWHGSWCSTQGATDTLILLTWYIVCRAMPIMNLADAARAISRQAGIHHTIDPTSGFAKNRRKDAVMDLLVQEVATPRTHAILKAYEQETKVIIGPFISNICCFLWDALDVNYSCTHAVRIPMGCIDCVNQAIR